MNHPGKKCGKGVYVTPYIDIAEQYTDCFGVFELNKKYRIVYYNVELILIRSLPGSLTKSVKIPE